MARTRNAGAGRRVLEAAFALSSRRGCPHVTIDEIAAAAGVGRQTIHRW